MIQIGFSLRFSFKASFFKVSSECVPFYWFTADSSYFSIFPKLVTDLKFIWESKLVALRKLPLARQVAANFLIILIQLIASLPKPLRSRCNPPMFYSFEVIFSLSMTSNCKLYECLSVLITVKEALPLSACVNKLEMKTGKSKNGEMKTVLSGKVFSINFFRSSNFRRTTLYGSFTLPLFPICNTFLTILDIILHDINCCSGEILNFDFSIPFWNSPFLSATEHWIANYQSAISTLFLLLFPMKFNKLTLERIYWYVFYIPMLLYFFIPMFFVLRLIQYDFIKCIIFDR